MAKTRLCASTSSIKGTSQYKLQAVCRLGLGLRFDQGKFQTVRQVESKGAKKTKGRKLKKIKLKKRQGPHKGKTKGDGQNKARSKQKQCERNFPIKTSSSCGFWIGDGL